MWTALGLLILLAAYLAVLEYSRPHVVGGQMRIDTFVDLAERGRIRSARILDVDSYVVGTFDRDGQEVAYNTPYLKDTRQRLVDVMLENRVPTTIDQQNSKRTAQLASLLLPSLILILLFVYLILSHRRGTGLFGVRSGARAIAADDEGVTFADVAGHDAAVAELREIKQFLTEPARFAALGAQVPKGVLLFGPPGCGKTLLARALANEAGASFLSISGSDFVELYVGVGAARVRDLFKQARESAPAIIFIDELDSIGRSRGMVGAVQSHGEQEQGLNQILAEMDGFARADGIIVLGATNRPDVLDPALLRPGRFDRTIGLERPDENGRLAILTVHAANKQLEAHVELATIARRAIGLTGADLASLMNEAALLAARAGKQLISQTELEEALGRIMEAPERQRRLSMRPRSIGRRAGLDERVTFADIGGMDDALAELAEVKDYLANPERFAAVGARAPRGILLTGPPGCGKTLLAKAVAGEANAAFLSAAGSEFVEVFVGTGASRVRDLFADARSVAPAIVFIDEIDAIGGHRGGMNDGGERESTLNQILIELDGFEAQGGVLLMAATNRPDMLDAALVRPGRIDRTVEIIAPDRAGRRTILDIHAKGKRLSPDVDLDAIAGLTRDFSGADLANVMNEAALLAGRRNRPEIGMVEIEEGIDRASMGISSRRNVMSEAERRVIAWHEAGHALVALALPAAAPPYKLTILPRASTLGHMRHLDKHDRVVLHRSDLIDEMAVSLGGVLAERLEFGQTSTGSSSDLEWVGNMARRMVREWGMSDALGLVAYPDQVGRDGRRQQTFAGQQAAATIDVEVRRLVDAAELRASGVLAAWRKALRDVAEALLEHETLTADELEKIAGPPPPTS